MHTATALKKDKSPVRLGRRDTDMALAIDGPNALIQCQVSSAVAAAMLVPLGPAAVGQFRPLAGNRVEIDACVTLLTAARMIEAFAAAQEASQRLH
jgi:hypothetical protein